jgi:hypothetical protein
MAAAAKTLAVNLGGITKHLTVEMVPISFLVPSPNNTKKHTPAQVASIVKSIQEFGFNDPIAVTETGEIVCGHGRRLALLKLKSKQAPVVKLVGLTPDQIRAYRIAHNKITMDTGFDMDILRSEISDLDIAGYDISMTGFTLADLSMELPSNAATTPAVDDTEKETHNTGPKATKSTVQYILIFDDEQQQTDWYKFLKHLRTEYEDKADTVAGKVLYFLKEQHPEIV